MNILLTKSTAPIIGWVAEILGVLMDGIFYVINALGFPNVALAIILFTIIMYVLMTPLQIKQQKFSKMNAVMQPELQKIQKMYGGKKDTTSMQKMNQETQAVYEKYGVSPTGSCLQLLIQMPVMFALYQVIYRIPGYISLIGDTLGNLASKEGFTEFFVKFVDGLESKSLIFTNQTKEAVIDVIYKLNPSQWAQLADASKGEAFANEVVNVQEQVAEWTSFFSLNIADAPKDVILDAISNGKWLILIAAAAIPVLAWLTQVLNTKLMPQADNGNDNSSTANTMKQMNTIMPLMSLFFCAILPIGVGIYWIAGAVVRTIQMLIINKQMDKMDINELVQKNLEKVNKKREKQGLPPQRISKVAKIDVRNIEEEKEEKARRAAVAAEKAKASTEYYRSTNVKSGSIASKANMVKQYEERNMKKK